MSYFKMAFRDTFLSNLHFEAASCEAPIEELQDILKVSLAARPAACCKAPIEELQDILKVSLVPPAGRK